MIEAHFSNVPMTDILQSLGKTCIKKTGATMENLMQLHDYKNVSVTREAKCLVSCMLESFGIVHLTDDGVETDSLNLYFSVAFRPEEHDAVMDIWNVCWPTVAKNPDHCQFIYDQIQCFIRRVNEGGLIPIPFW